MADLALRNVVKRFGEVEVIKGVDLEVKHGEFVVFVGPSGCGKSTLLRIISGLEGTTSGSIEIGGAEVSKASPADRGIAMVFQSYALYPHMTVAQNLSFGLENTRKSKAEIKTRIDEAARMLELEPYLQRKPRELSGGQRQRVAIGRAIVREPSVFLFDEPLSNLDAALRVQMRAEIGKLHRRLQTTMIYVTHDQVEAMTMADRIAVVNAGRIEQFGAPLELFEHPVNRFVAGFIGSPRMNFYQGTIKDSREGVARVFIPGFGDLTFEVDRALAEDGVEVELGVRPTYFAFGEEGDPQAIAFQVEYAESVGTETYVYGKIVGNPATTILHFADHVALKENDQLRLRPALNRAHLFRISDGKSLNASFVKTSVPEASADSAVH
ncbi:ABC transporter ATP-binding protein [Martelella mediterranea]|uniref:Carbohydrate ABC transporter ATP-binding protein (CUT1 family) n=1 Tax=Martelella mediterranea TaxID=293089 RepID=A0A4R3NET1_9HYPH|nr:sn-glycerol-3-phosphate ABC transporter ATP-binding protein UgpC [Martelella mediterranea]TCT30845.1 carbohydrate ABC transporter ATP-binding protein (CUT1 family) [Martelella mediterranea]